MERRQQLQPARHPVPDREARPRAPRRRRQDGLLHLRAQPHRGRGRSSQVRLAHSFMTF